MRKWVKKVNSIKRSNRAGSNKEGLQTLSSGEERRRDRSSDKES